MMSKRIAILLSVFLALSCCTYAQTKVFKEVGKGITSYMRAIIQDDQVVGYLRFTQLEKATADSFNYEIEIMDENLNDLGTVKFEEEQIHLQSVAFEKDVLCLAYLKSNIIGTEFKNKRSYKKSLKTAKNAVTMQFVSLSGKILNTVSTDVSIPLKRDAFRNQFYGGTMVFVTSIVGYGNLEHPLQLSNLPGKGFVCFYGDDKNNYLTAYSVDGKQLWKKEKPGEAIGYTLHTSGDKTYLLRKTENKMKFGGYDLLAFDSTGTEHASTTMVDKAGEQLRCLAIGNDPQTGKMYLTGSIIDHKRGNKLVTPKDLAKGTFDGVFSLNAGENDSMKFNFSSWRSGKYPTISKKGYFRATKNYTILNESFKDNSDNAYFVGSSYSKKTRVGVIVTSVLTAPTVIVPLYLLSLLGTRKTQIQDTKIIRQDPNGQLTVVAAVKGDPSYNIKSSVHLSWHYQRAFFHVANSDTKKNFVVIKDKQTIKLYNVTDNKLFRTIDRVKKGNTIDVLPAKEGHILVTEYDAKEKSTRYAIEAL